MFHSTSDCVCFSLKKNECLSVFVSHQLFNGLENAAGPAGVLFPVENQVINGKVGYISDSVFFFSFCFV